MAIETLQSRQKVLPSAASGVSLTMVASWAAGTWVQVTASTVAAWLLSGISFTGEGSNSDFFAWEIEVGTGGAGSETIVCTFAGRNTGSGTGGWGNPQNILLPILLDNIANGVRVAVRGRKETATNRTWLVKVHYYEKPVTGTVSTTAKPLKNLPPASAGALVTPNGTAWNNSAWAQITASTAAALVLFGAYLHVNTTDHDGEIDIGVGGAGAETVVETIRYGNDGERRGCPWVLRCFPPFDGIGSAVRLAVRMRKGDTNTGLAGIGVLVMEKPL